MYEQLMSLAPVLSVPSWHDDASCSGCDPSLWTLTDGPEGRRTEESAELENVIREQNKANFEKAEVICSTCPVFTKCWETSNITDRRVTMRAGAWPTDYTDPQSAKLITPQKVAGTRRFLGQRKTHCKNGHDVRDPNARYASGSCRACTKVSSAASKRRLRGVR